MTRADIVGAWRLDSFFIDRASGERIHPYGEDALGTLLYTPEGWMSAVLARRDRGAHDGATLERAHRASDEERLRAFDGYTSYSGRYRVRGQTVEHDVVVALVPSMIGATLQRTGTLEDGALTLRYDVEGRRGTHRYTLRWSRADEASS